MKLYYAKKKGIENNAEYPYSAEVNNADELKKVVCFDNICACMKSNHRNKVNFLSANSLAFDADNNHSDEPDDWITFDDVADAFHEVRFYAVESRNHMKVKNGKAPRPKYHFYFPLSHSITDGEKYKDLIMKATALFPYFDTNALDVSRYYNSVGDDPKCIYIDGDLTLDQFLESVSLDEVEKTLTGFEFLQSEHGRLFEYFGFDKPDTLGGNKFAKSTGFVLPETIEFGERNDTLYRFACSLQARAYSDDEIYSKVSDANENRCEPPLGKSELDKIIKSALKYPKGNSIISPSNRTTIQMVNDKLEKKKGKDNAGKTIFLNKPTMSNMVKILTHDDNLKGKIRYNSFAYCLQYFGQLPWRKEDDTFGEWSDFDDASLRLYIGENYQIDNKDQQGDALLYVARVNGFNPIINWLEALPVWDGVERIKHLLPDYLGVEESEYTYEVMKLFMLGAISRIYNPGCKFDYMLVLVGSQGIGKSQFVRRLAINDIWLDDNFNSFDPKTAVEKMRGKWILECSELTAMKRVKDAEAIKSFITSNCDSYREPYAKRTEQRKRSCVLIGTTNDMEFLTDRTGNRRFLPIEATKNKSRNLFDADTLEYFIMAWSEALHIFKEANGNPLLILPDPLASEALERQARHLEDDPDIGSVEEHLNTVAGRVCVKELWEVALKQGDARIPRNEAKRLHEIMRNMSGWVAVDGKRKCGKYGSQRCYERVTEWQAVDDSEPF